MPPADGSVILFGSVGPLTIAPHLMKLTYDPFKDLAPLSGGVNFPNVLVVHKGAGVKTLAEFVAAGQEEARQVDFASTGAGSASHLAGELFNQRAGIDMVHVPYKGGAPALQDLLGERVTSYFAAPAHRPAACAGRQADPPGHHRPDTPGLPAGHPHRGRSRLPRL